MSVQVSGIQEVAQAIDRIIQALEHGGELDFGVAVAARDEGAHYAAFIAPKDTGALAQAQTVFVQGDTTIIGIDPSVVNPKSGTRPEVYGPIVAARAFDFYQKVLDDRSDRIVNRAIQEFVQAVNR
jgi:hypothetical protein